MAKTPHAPTFDTSYGCVQVYVCTLAVSAQQLGPYTYADL